MADWTLICEVNDIARRGARCVRRTQGADVAVFRCEDDRVFALLDRCPHLGGPLSQGIVFEDRVACPLHNWTIGLADGCAVSPDEGCTQPFAVSVQDGRVYLDANELATRGLASPSASNGGSPSQPSQARSVDASSTA